MELNGHPLQFQEEQCLVWPCAHLFWDYLRENLREGIFIVNIQIYVFLLESSLNMFQLLHPNFETLSSLMKKRCSKEQYMGPQMASY